LIFENNRFFIVFTCKNVLVDLKPKTGESIGIDLGLKDAMNLSNGFKSGKIKSSKLDNRVKRLNKKLSHQIQGSNKWLRTKTKLNNVYYHKKEMIKDFIHKTTTYIVKNFDLIVVSNVNSKLGLGNHKLARTTADQHWFELKRQLEYKSDWYAKEFKLVNESYTSQVCNVCGFRNEDLELEDMSWICPNCGIVHDRDVNAAKNILTVGRTGVKNILYVFSNAHSKTNI
jgi:putative transposase